MFGRNKDRDAKSLPPERVAPSRSASTPGSGSPVRGTDAPAKQPGPQNGRLAPGPQGGRLAYEARRAEKAGMGLEKWMAEKSRRVQEQRLATERVQRKAATATAKPGLLRRLLDRAHKPL